MRDKLEVIMQISKGSKNGQSGDDKLSIRFSYLSNM